MARARSLRPHLNQIRSWVRQGRTDAWVAHQLEVTVQQIQTFKRENELTTDRDGADPTSLDFPEEIDLRAEDDARIAAELEAEAEAAAARAAAEAEAEAARAPEEDGDEDAAPRRRGRRGGRGRRTTRSRSGPLEGTFDHGEEGYGLWLDPAVQDDPIYAEHWAGHRPIVVTVEEEQIVIRRAGEDAAPSDDDDE